MYRWYVDFPVAFARSLRLGLRHAGQRDQRHGVLVSGGAAPARRRRSGAGGPRVRRAPGAGAGERRLAPEQEWPLAVLGPFPAGAAFPWNPEQALDLGATYETAIGEPFQDVTGPPWPVRWQATRTRHRFVDFEAIHRAKRSLTPLGLSDRHVLPPGTGTFVLATLCSAAACRCAGPGGLRGRVGAVAQPAPGGAVSRRTRWTGAPSACRSVCKRGRTSSSCGRPPSGARTGRPGRPRCRLRGPDGLPPAGIEVAAERLAGLPETLERWREPGPDRSRGSLGPLDARPRPRPPSPPSVL